MKVSSARPITRSERHVEFAEQVQVRVIEPTDTAPIRPSITAQRIERHLRVAGIGPVNHAQPQTEQTRSETPPSVRVCKNVLHSMAMVFGALFVPSFALVLLGPIGLVAPAALLVAAAVCAFLGGKPTEEMERARAIRRAEMQEYDPR